MKAEVLTLGEMQTNCILAYDEITKRGWITDPGAEALAVSAKLSELGVKPEAILLTHGHFDHIMAADKLRERYRIPVYAHRAEAGILGNAQSNLSALWAVPYRTKADVLTDDGQLISLAGYEIKVLHTPGHTAGSVCYYIESEGVLLSGDTMFCESYGRTDFESGSLADMRRSIRGLLRLPDETAVYPGHGGMTMIRHERQYNPAAD